MRKKDIVNLILVDLVDLTDGPFKVEIASDDGGTHIEIYIENHDDSQEILSAMTVSYPSERIIVMKVPIGYILD